MADYSKERSTGSPTTSDERVASEDDLISWLRDRSAHSGGRWIGDDAAILPRGEPWAVTMDTQIEGIHFLPGLDPAILAKRLMAVNLSDLAAMGALPAYAFLALSAPSEFDYPLFFDTLVATCDEHGLELAGGDLSRQRSVATVLTLLGSKPSGQRWLRRHSAKVGESVWLGGTVGEAAVGLKLLRAGVTCEAESLSIPDHLGLPADLMEAAMQAIHRHLFPSAQIDLGCWLGSQSAGAAIDISDGLARDLDRLCSQSGVGAAIEIDRLPLSAQFKSLAGRLASDWKDLALSGGEDYVLLFTLPPCCEPPDRFGCTRIGTVTESELIVSDAGSRRPLPVVGWDHFSFS